MTLTATTLLAANTEPILHALCARLGAVHGAVEFDDTLDGGERRALVEAGQVDLVWACGLLTAELIDEGVPLRVVAAPILPGETAAVYRSVVVARADGPASVVDALAGRLAVNEYGSWSGWHAYRAHLHDRGLHVDAHPTQVITGSHHASVHAVADGVADVASIDSSVWRWLQDVDSRTAHLRVIDTTRDWAAPPLSVVSPVGGLADTMRTSVGLEEATADPYVGMLAMSRR